MDTLTDRYTDIRQQIRNACLAAGRPGDACHLLAVSKTRGADEIRALAALGQRDFGENYVQEALAKMAQLEGLALAWHLIGPLQSNKTREVAERFDWVHSLDREKIARRLDEQRPAGMAPLNVCIQVNIDDEDSKSGVAPEGVPALAAVVMAMPRLRLRGLMTIPRPGQHGGSGNAYARLATTLQELVATIPGLAGSPGAAPAAPDTLSMGMSDDFTLAIAQGATWVRIGTALFGPRPARPG
jgi:pyridoxal phosphate enzyme (YggS family)